VSSGEVEQQEFISITGNQKTGKGKGSYEVMAGKFGVCPSLLQSPEIAT
jgi:hypothetical protein